jgi:hypothetical protein
VLKSAIEKENVLPNEMVRDILVANPQSAKSEDVLEKLNERVVAMPEPMMSEIIEGKSRTSPKEALDATLQSHLLKKNNLLNQLVLWYKTDIVSPRASHDSLLSLLRQERSIEANYQLAFEYFCDRDTVMLNATMNNIPGSFSFASNQSQTYQDYLNYFSYLKSIQKSGKNIMQIDSIQVTRLNQICLTASEPVKTFARNILLANGLITYHEPILLPDELKSTEGDIPVRTSVIASAGYLKLFPNPAQQYLIVEYNLKNLFNLNTEISLNFYSMNGLLKDKKIITRQQNQTIVKTSTYDPGLYICTLEIDGKMKESQKFTVIP